MFYLLDKPAGISSFLTIKKFAREHQIKKIGHTGTLDPLATGLLLVATNDDTKLINFVDKGFKRYRVSIIFNQSSNTYDSTGEIIKHQKLLPSYQNFAQALRTFLGHSQQVPPNFSAKKIKGVRAYELARQKLPINLKKIEVEMKDLKILNYYQDKAVFEISVSRGTYIRSLVNDLGIKLNCPSLMTSLRRISLGDLTENDLNQEIDPHRILIYPFVEIFEIKQLKEGKAMAMIKDDGTYTLFYKNQVVGIGKVMNNHLKAIKLLGNKL